MRFGVASPNFDVETSNNYLVSRTQGSLLTSSATRSSCISFVRRSIGFWRFECDKQRIWNLRLQTTNAGLKMPKCLVAYALGILLIAYLLVSIQCVEFQALITGGHRSALPDARFDVHGGNLEYSFRTINRRKLSQCNDINPYLQLTLDTAGPLSDVQTVTVNVSGVLNPSDNDWVAVVSPSNSR